MSHLAQRFFRILPESVRHRIIRRKLRIPRITRTVGSEFTFKIAETREELEKAYSLLHDCYVRTNLMKPHPSGLRCSVYSALPYTTTIIAKHGEKVIGTVSLIKDSEIGFPSDKEYQAENDAYREKGHRMIEVSALAVSPEYRSQGHLVSLHLMKYLYLYATRFMDCDMLCATVHPRAWDFYAALFGFRRNGRVVQYGFVQGALATHLTLNLRWVEAVFLPQKFDGVNRERDMHSFITREASPFMFPQRPIASVVDPVMTPELLRHFFVARTGLFSELNARELALIRSAYALHFDLETVPRLGEAELPDREFRYPTRFHASVRLGDGMKEGKVLDLSSGGLFFEYSGKMDAGQVYDLEMEIDGESIRLPCAVRWINSGTLKGRSSLRYPEGYGLRFLVQDVRVVRFLKRFHQQLASASARREKAA